MVNSIRLRTAEAGDIEFLAQVVFDSNQERYAARPGWDPVAFLRGLVDDAADQVAGGPPNSATYVIVDDGVRVGRLRLVTTPGQVEIAGLQVHPAHQNRGIGRAIVTQVVRRAEVEGRRIALEVELDNPRAQRLYERLGFVPTGVVTGDRRTMIHQSREL